jgi:hypothetical protein
LLPKVPEPVPEPVPAPNDRPECPYNGISQKVRNCANI